MKPIAKYMLSAGGAGLMPVAPGTWGSAVAAALFLGCVLAHAGPAALVLLLAGLIAWGAWATVHFGPEAVTELGDDPGMIVSDEVAGQAVTFLWLWHTDSWSPAMAIAVAVTGFLLFRFFDITKPWPSCYFDRMKSPFGILMDDIAAGVYAAIGLQLLRHLGWLEVWIGALD